jgi:hypothetical protein
MIEVPDMDGKTVRVPVEEISSWGDDKAMLAISRIGVCIWPLGDLMVKHQHVRLSLQS